MQKNALSLSCAASLLLLCAAPASAQTPPPLKNLNGTGQMFCVTTTATATTAWTTAISYGVAACNAAQTVAGNAGNVGDRFNIPATAALAAATYNAAPRQGARFGRDGAAAAGVLPAKVGASSNNANAFDYTKICVNGEEEGKGSCAPNPTLFDQWDNLANITTVQAQMWGCTRDNVTGRIWSMESQGVAAPISRANATNPATNRVTAYNNYDSGKGLCGVNEWRLPSRRELLSLVNSAVVPAATVVVDAGFIASTGMAAVNTANSAYYWAAESGTAAAGGWTVSLGTATGGQTDSAAASASIRLVSNAAD